MAWDFSLTPFFEEHVIFKVFVRKMPSIYINDNNVNAIRLIKILIDQFWKSPNLKYEDVAGSTDLLIIEKQNI